MRKISIADVGKRHLQSMLDREVGLCAKLRMCSLEHGQYSAIVPSGNGYYDVSRPQSGGLLAVGEGDEVYRSMADHLRRGIPEGRGGSLIVQSPWSDASDAVPRDADDDHLLRAGFGVCHWCKVEDLTGDEFSYLVGDTIAMQFAGCLISADMTITAACQSADNEFARSVVAIVVPAYDGESMVLWERDPA